VLAAAVIEYLVRSSSYVPLNHIVGGSSVTTLVKALQTRASDGLPYAVMLTLAWYGADRLSSMRTAAPLAALGALACVAIAPVAWSSWHTFYFTDTLRAAFADWRRQIPPHAEVIWPATPVGAWYLLDRPSYWSVYQVPGDIFSRQKGLEVHRRGLRVLSALASPEVARQKPKEPPETLPKDVEWVDSRGLAVLCTDPALGFVVTWSRLGKTPFQPVQPIPAKPRDLLHLYRCDDFRAGGRGQSTSPYT
jgi:hypothetical protein